MKNQEQKSNSTTRTGAYEKGSKNVPMVGGLEQGRKSATDVIAGINKVKIQHHDPMAIQPKNKKKPRRFEGSRYGVVKSNSKSNIMWNS